MNGLSQFLFAHKKLVVWLFVIGTVLCIVLQFGVGVNYNLADYLPDDSASTVAINVMTQEFTTAAPNLRVYVPDVTVPEALEFKKKIQNTKGILEVIWLDDTMNVKQPLETLDAATVDAYYKDGGALFMVAADTEENAVDILTALRGLSDKKIAIAGDLAINAATQLSVQNELTKIMAVLAPLIVIILLLTTNSWFEPVLFFIVIVVSILINLGTNIFFGEVSFLTQGVAPILQLAVSMDYVIFLLNSFRRCREEGQEAEPAMKNAMKKTAATVLASGITTVIGFLVLLLMRFKIGPDMGIVLAKGICISMATSLLLLPVITLYFQKALEKTAHKPFLPSFKKFSKFTVKIRIPVFILVLIILVPCYLAQKNATFTYGSSGSGNGSQIGEDMNLIEDKFGKSIQMVLLVPRGQWGAEIALNENLEQLDNVQSVISYVKSVGSQIPTEFVPESQASQLLSTNYSRIIINAEVPEEGKESFALVEKVRSVTQELYGDSYHLCGLNVSNYDMRDTITTDNLFVNGAALIAIGIVLMLTFRSLSLPFLLLLSIETAIWVNMGIPYFLDYSTPYIAYLIISAVQLGATIDYAILLTSHYIEHREFLPKKEAMLETIAVSAPSILVPALILTCAGLSLGIISTNPIVGQVGMLLARGTICSAISVIFFLPVLLLPFDRIIQKTSLKLKFLKERNDEK